MLGQVSLAMAAFYQREILKTMGTSLTCTAGIVDTAAGKGE